MSLLRKLERESQRLIQTPQASVLVSKTGLLPHTYSNVFCPSEVVGPRGLTAFYPWLLITVPFNLEWQRLGAVELKGLLCSCCSRQELLVLHIIEFLLFIKKKEI